MQDRSRMCPAGSIKFPYFNNIISPTLKKSQLLKKKCTGSANYHVLQSFEVFFYGKIRFFLFTCLWQQDLNPKKIVFFFSEILTHRTIGFFTRKMVACGWNVPYLEVHGIYK